MTQLICKDTNLLWSVKCQTLFGPTSQIYILALWQDIKRCVWTPLNIPIKTDSPDFWQQASVKLLKLLIKDICMPKKPFDILEKCWIETNYFIPLWELIYLKVVWSEIGFIKSYALSFQTTMTFEGDFRLVLVIVFFLNL